MSADESTRPPAVYRGRLRLSAHRVLILGLCLLSTRLLADQTENDQVSILAELDLVTIERSQGGSTVFEKLEGTVSLGDWSIRPLAIERQPVDGRWYAVTVPFTLHPARDGVYQRLRLAIVLDPKARVVELLPMALERSGTKPLPAARDALLSRHCRAQGLEPTVRAYGLGEHSFSWTLDRRSGLRDGSKTLCALLRLPASARTLTARILVDAEIGRPLLPLSKSTVPTEVTHTWSLAP